MKIRHKNEKATRKPKPKTPAKPPKWCWRAAAAANSCHCQDGCVIPPELR